MYNGENPLELNTNIGVKEPKYPRRSILNRLKNHLNDTSMHQLIFDASAISNQQDYGPPQPGKGKKTHFQGIQRCFDSNYIIISGGEAKKKLAQLFIIKLKNTDSILDKKRAIFRNNGQSKFGEIEKIFIADSGNYWHAGGMDTYGNILAVAIESDKDKKGKIKFYSTSNMPDLKELKKLEFSTDWKASAVSIFRLKNDYYICAVLHEKTTEKRYLTIYTSNTTNINDGFRRDKLQINFPHENDFNGPPSFQNIKLIQSPNGDYLIIGTRNETKISAVSGQGTNEMWIYNFELEFINQRVKPKKLTKKYRKDVGYTRNEYNFDAGTGMAYSSEGCLSFYSVAHWIKNNKISVVEFFDYSLETKSDDLKDAVIEMYEDDNFRGRCLRIVGNNSSTISDLDTIRVNGKNFGKAVSSIKYIIPKGFTYRLYSGINFDSDFGNGHFDLIGTGELEEIENLNKLDYDDYGDDAMSGRYIKSVEPV